MQIFNNEKYGAVRTVVDKTGKIWFFGEDIVEDLGYNLETNSYTTFIKRFVKDKYKLKVDSKTQLQNVIKLNYKELGQRGGYLINEYGVIQLVMNSPLPQAEEFQDWIIEEVIPSVLSTGSYSVNKQSQTPQLTQEESLALSILRANDMGERALAIQEYGSYKHKEGMLNGIVQISEGHQVTLRQVGGFINEAMSEQFDKIGYIQSDTVVATDFRRFLAKQGHYTMQRFPKKGQEGEYEMKRHYQPTDLFRTSIVEQGMGYIKNIDDERGKLEGFFYDTITNLINNKDFQKAFLKFLKVKYTYMTPVK